MTKLSILIPTLARREYLLNRVLKQLSSQRRAYGAQVEILTESDSGRLSIGEKRNRLVGAAKGQYIAFVDDDDRISPKYLELIMPGLETNPDCCSLTGIVSFDGRRHQQFVHSVKYDHWFEKSGVLYRCPNHLNCIRADHVRAIPFKEISHGEDADFSLRLQKSGLLQTEYWIAPTLYYYDYRSKK